MTFFDFLDIRYRSLNLELQVHYTIAKDAELKAAYQLIQGQRVFFKWLQMPILIMKFLLVQLHLLKTPTLLTRQELDDAPLESPASTEAH